MHKVVFYPIGNADCCKMDLEDGRILLFDYAYTAAGEDGDDPRIDLEKTLRQELKEAKRNDFDVVGFTHADEDHIKGSSDFFYFEHAEKYQSDDRIKIKELWVPAAIILEEGLTGEARILRTEARHRLIKQGKGIRVFSRPERLKDWIEKQGVKWEDRKDLTTDAGGRVPNFDDKSKGVEFFVHSPFAVHVDGGMEDRNDAALIFHVTFFCGDEATRFFLIGDTTDEILESIVEVTRFHDREDRLKWDMYDIPHHCSFGALNQKEKGDTKTEPLPNVKWLLDQGQSGAILISSSDAIPDTDTTPPPHMQAANYYREVATKKKGEFRVTMTHPNKDKPEPLVITIDENKARIKKEAAEGLITVLTKPSRAGGIR